MSDYTALVDALDQVLAHAIDAHTDAGLTAPARTFLSPGPPAAECDLLAVYATPRAKDESTQTRCSILHQADITVHRWMCLDIVKPIPGKDALDAVGRAFHNSLWATWFYLAGLATRGELIDGAHCTRARIVNDSVQLLEEEGGMAAWLFQIRVDLGSLLTPGPAS